MDDRFERAKKRIGNIIAQLKAVDWNFYSGWSDFEGNFPNSIGEASGASRQVFWDYNHEDFVLKVGFGKEDAKYCEKEETVYLAAKEQGLEKYFGWTAYICTVDNMDIYAMEFLDCDECRVSDDSYQYHYELYCDENELDPNTDEAREQWEDLLESDWSMSMDNSDAVTEWFLDRLDWQERNELSIFLRDWDINDLHAANVGYRGNMPVFADYAGWGW